MIRFVADNGIDAHQALAMCCGAGIAFAGVFVGWWCSR